MSRLNNKVQLIGHLGDGLKMHYFENGNCVGNVSLATNNRYKTKDGETVNEAEWHNLVFRNKGAELAEKYTNKGSKIMVEGRLKYRKWDDKEGVTRYSTEIHVNDFTFLDQKPEGGSERKPVAPPQDQSSGPAVPPPVQGSDNDDLPF